MHKKYISNDQPKSDCQSYSKKQGTKKIILYHVNNLQGACPVCC